MGREMLPLCVHFCVMALPWGRERGHITLEMSRVCVCLNGEGSSFVSGLNGGFYDYIWSMEVAHVSLYILYYP